MLLVSQYGWFCTIWPDRAKGLLASSVRLEFHSTFSEITKSNFRNEINELFLDVLQYEDDFYTVSVVLLVPFVILL